MTQIISIAQIEAEELRMLRERTERNVQRRECETLDAELHHMQRARRQERRREQQRRERVTGFCIGTGTGILAVLGYALTLDLGAALIPALIGSALLRKVGR